MTEELLIRIAKGEQPAFDQLFRDTNATLLAYATSLMAGDRSGAEDVVDEAFIAIWRGAAGYAGSGSAMGWIRRIVRNKAVDELRRIRERPVFDGSYDVAAANLEDTEPKPDQASETKSVSRLLKAALALLNVDQREAIWLCYYEEKSVAEIAEIIGCPVNTVKTRLFYARKALAQSGLLCASTLVN